MQRDKAHLIDILEASRIAISHVEDLSLHEFLEDLKCQDAVIRRLEIIGEAAKRLSAETLENYPSIPWR